MANIIRVAVIVSLTLVLLKVAGGIVAIAVLAFITAKYVVQPLVLRTEYYARRAVNDVRARRAA